MAYVKTTWNEGLAPGISAVNLNNLETQYDEAIADIIPGSPISAPFDYIGSGTSGARGAHAAVILDATQFADAGFSIPANFTSLTSAKVVAIHTVSENIDWTVVTHWGAIGEAYNAHTDGDTANAVACTADELKEIDISAAFTGLAANDKVGVQFTLDVAVAGLLYLLRVEIIYT